jgi:hypothetical protein
VVEDLKMKKKVIIVKSLKNKKSERRNVMNEGLKEKDLRELEMKEVNGYEKEKMMGVGVRKGGKLVTGEINVKKGKKMKMEILIEKKSDKVYGMIVR